jgi:hypothetical protein
MQVSRTNELEGGRAYHSIGRIKVSSGWRAADAHGSETNRLKALRALVSEARELDADAVIGLSLEVEAIDQPDYRDATLRPIATTGIAVRFTEAARTYPLRAQLPRTKLGGRSVARRAKLVGIVALASDSDVTSLRAEVGVATASWVSEEPPSALAQVEAKPTVRPASRSRATSGQWRRPSWRRRRQYNRGPIPPAMPANVAIETSAWTDARLHERQAPELSCAVALGCPRTRRICGQNNVGVCSRGYSGPQTITYCG